MHEVIATSSAHSDSTQQHRQQKSPAYTPSSSAKINTCTSKKQQAFLRVSMSLWAAHLHTYCTHETGVLTRPCAAHAANTQTLLLLGGGMNTKLRTGRKNR